MCFMTFTGEKSGDIFDGFGDGYDGNAGDGGVNDKENERINSRAITFGSVCKKNGQSYKVGEEFDVGNLRYKCQEFGVYVIEGCRTHTGKAVKLGDIEVIDHVKFHCLAHGTSVYYRETACGQKDEVPCDKVPLPRGYEAAVKSESEGKGAEPEKLPEHETHVNGRELPKGWILVHNGGVKDASNDTFSTHVLMYHPQLHHAKAQRK
uniref:Abnormal cell migration protein 18-like fibronectin type I domain-containing protein n=1 Tax=Caenorhabditis japonica TaxID=281687 RepID=A0A8R1I4R8_CAEJA